MGLILTMTTIIVYLLLFLNQQSTEKGLSLIKIDLILMDMAVKCVKVSIKLRVERTETRNCAIIQDIEQQRRIRKLIVLLKSLMIFDLCTNVHVIHDLWALFELKIIYLITDNNSMKGNSFVPPQVATPQQYFMMNVPLIDSVSHQNKPNQTPSPDFNSAINQAKLNNLPPR